MTPPRIITTDRLMLRAIEIGDAQLAFGAYAQDPDVAAHMSWRMTGKFDDTRSFVEQAVGWWNEPATAHDFVYAMFLKDPEIFIGCCSAGPHFPSTPYHWGIGYNLAKTFWGNGYATEGIAALSQYALDRPEVFRVSATVAVPNRASGRVLEKCGFMLEGTLKRFSIFPNVSEEPMDALVYALTK